MHDWKFHIRNILRQSLALLTFLPLASQCQIDELRRRFPGCPFFTSDDVYDGNNLTVVTWRWIRLEVLYSEYPSIKFGSLNVTSIGITVSMEKECVLVETDRKGVRYIPPVGLHSDIWKS